ncbi:hypothetical protein [Microcoleus vaginatus]|uniref:hypothetical protein n=1 Tax=Microcoleus vaginatus TaxID=119532 RepID=UPI001F61A514|nr:hypothetical protein D0A37_27990 [Microcoleus vaginatus HSN003]
MWFALFAQHDLWQRCCSSAPRETDLRKIRPSCRAQFDPILPSLAAFVWQEAREGERLSPVAIWTIAHGGQFPRLKEVVAERLMRKCLN